MFIGPPSQTSRKDSQLVKPINGFGNGTANGTANGISNGGLHVTDEVR